MNLLNKTSCEACPHSGAREGFISGKISLTNFYLYILYALYMPKSLEARGSNVLFVDELIDSGMDTQGVENSLALLKKMSRERHQSIWLVSHRDELVGRVENILRVVKENGFTSYTTDTETA